MSRDTIEETPTAALGFVCGGGVSLISLAQYTSEDAVAPGWSMWGVGTTVNLGRWLGRLIMAALLVGVAVIIYVSVTLG